VLITVLGSAAGGGFPQWNCGCANCVGVRAGSIRARARTQESVAVSADGAAWFVLNTSPEIRQQLESSPALHPRAPRHSPVEGVVLTNGDLDHCLGLLSLRESYPLAVYASEPVFRGFSSDNVLYRTLQRFPEQVTWHRLTEGQEIPLLAGGKPSGLAMTPFAVSGKLPLHLEGLSAPHPEDNVGLVIHETSTGKKLAYVPACGGPSPRLDHALAGADCVFFDGTFWSSDELVVLGIGTRRAEDMAHWPIGGRQGSLAMLSRLASPRRIFIHVNNTNPMLREDSPEYRAVRDAGAEVAFDGMQVIL
jgi:pyrroloquinoline quinone biosynthesis protein B